MKCQGLVFILDQFKFIKGVLHYIAEGDDEQEEKLYNK